MICLDGYFYLFEVIIIIIIIILETIGQLGKRVGHAICLFFLFDFKGQFVIFFGKGGQEYKIWGVMFKLFVYIYIEVKFLKKLRGAMARQPRCGSLLDYNNQPLNFFLSRSVLLNW